MTGVVKLGDLVGSELRLNALQSFVSPVPPFLTRLHCGVLSVFLILLSVQETSLPLH